MTSKKKAPSAPPEIELEPDAWERFEKTIDRGVKAPRQDRAPKEKAEGKKDAKRILCSTPTYNRLRNSCRGTFLLRGLWRRHLAMDSWGRSCGAGMAMPHKKRVAVLGLEETALAAVRRDDEAPTDRR
jgi:hypothetical protein